MKKLLIGLALALTLLGISAVPVDAAPDSPSAPTEEVAEATTSSFVSKMVCIYVAQTFLQNAQLLYDTDTSIPNRYLCQYWHGVFGCLVADVALDWYYGWYIRHLWVC